MQEQDEGDFAICACMEVIGKKPGIDQFAATGLIPDGEIKQLGLRRNPPMKDCWCYRSPMYLFHLETFEEEMHSFLDVHVQLAEPCYRNHPDIEWRFLALIPVGQTDEDYFRGYFSPELLHKLVQMGAGIDYSPQGFMHKKAPFWKPG